MSGAVPVGEGVGGRLARRFAERIIRSDLRSGFRRVVWVGERRPLDPAPGRPLVLYANHHYVADSYLLWHLTTQVLRRPMLVWMEAWDRAPLFGPVGALPFPAEDARQRVRTVRETARRMEHDARTALYLYPEGTMGVPEAGLQPFRADLPRLARVLPEPVAWWPVGVRLTWWGERLPTALLAAGPPHDRADGDERDRLAAVLGRLGRRPPRRPRHGPRPRAAGGDARRRRAVGPLAPRPPLPPADVSVRARSSCRTGARRQGSSCRSVSTAARLTVPQ